MTHTYTPMTLTKVKGFDDRRQGTIVHGMLSEEPTLHLVTVVTSKRGGRNHYAIYVRVGEKSGYAGYVQQEGIGRYRLVHRQYGQSPKEMGTGYIDHGKMVFFIEQVAHGYLTSREYYLSKDA